VFVRLTTTGKGDKRRKYMHLVESYRRPSDGQPRHRILANLGPYDPILFENLRLAYASAKDGGRVALVSTANAKQPLPKPDANLRYLDVAVVCELWRELGLSALIREALQESGADVPAESVVHALTVQRLVAPDSKLAAVRWFPRTALAELLAIQPKQFNNTRVHRVLDQLEAAVPAIMAKLPRLYEERDGRFVSLFMDVSDTWFVGHGPELAVHGKTKEGIIQRKVNIALLCNERGLPLRWEVLRGDTSDCEIMTTMLRAVARMSWVGDAPVVVDRAMGKTAQIQAMAAAGLRFLTALTRTEFGTYAESLPWAAVSDLPVAGDKAKVVAATCIEAAGMSKVSDSLFVRDMGLVDLPLAPPDAAHDGTAQGVPDEDPTVRSMRLALEIRQSVLDDKSGSFNAAGAARGVRAGSLNKLLSLLKLSDDLQRRVLEGELAGCALAPLVRAAKLEVGDAQRDAFEELVQTRPRRPKQPRHSPRPPERPPLTETEGSDELAEQATKTEASAVGGAKPEPRRVRVVAYFNPDQFVEQRRNALAICNEIESFADTLNTRLASPRSRMTRDKIIALIDRRLRKDEMLSAYDVTVNEHRGGERPRYTVALSLNADAWKRRRRYDGFSVLVGHAALGQSAAELCTLYRSKDLIEKDFQTIKSVVELRPVRHRTDLKLRAHVALCMLALILERTLALKLDGMHSPQRAIELLEPCRLNRYSNAGTTAVYNVTHPDLDQSNILKALRLKHLVDDDAVAERMTPR
jgi:hypothetical protein